MQVGKTVDRKGNPLTLKLSGPVEAWFEDLGADAPVAQKTNLSTGNQTRNQGATWLFP